MGSADVVLYAEWEASVYRHTIVIDGTNDFTSAETFVTTTAGYAAYVSWDGDNLYVGVQGADVGSGADTKWVLVYLGGSSGTTTGVAYNTQTPTLPFNAQWHVCWKANNLCTAVMEYSGSWVTTKTAPRVNLSGNFVELAVPLADIGSPSTSLPFHLCMINEGAGVEGTYCGVPSTTFGDRMNPAYTAYFDFGLTGTLEPNAYSAVRP